MSREELERRIFSCEAEIQSALTPLGADGIDEELAYAAQKELDELLALRESMGLK